MKIINTLLIVCTLTLHAEMKCESGKCGSDMTKKVEVKPNIQAKFNKKPLLSKHLEQLFNVQTVKIKKVQKAKEQVNYGYIVSQDAKEVEVTAYFSGYVQQLHADTLYQKVNKGQALASVYSPEVYKAKQDYLNAIRFNAKRPAENMVKSAKTKLILLGISKDEIESISNKGEVSRLTTLYAPISGWIFEKNIYQGSFFNEKKSLYKIIDLSKVWVEAKLFQNELSTLPSLESFQVHVKGINKVYDAKKELLYPLMNPKEATITLRLSLDNSDGFLKPGMYAKIHASTKSNTKMIIPRTAAIRKSGSWYVFLATEFKGEYEPIRVELKPLNSQYYEITKGLNTGDTVVNNALFMMDSDAQINSIY